MAEEGEKGHYTMVVVPFQEILNRMLAGKPLYGTPTMIAFDDYGRCYVWPLPHKVIVDGA